MSKESVRILIADDHHVMRRALRVYLQQEADVDVVGEVSDGAGLFPAVAQRRPDLLLLDVEMPNHQPLEATRALCDEYPDMKIVVLSAHSEPAYVVGLFRAGIDGYVMKDDASGSIVKAIREVMGGEQWISPQAATVLADYVRRNGHRLEALLTDREKEVLTLVAAGYRNEEIAQELVISAHTVRNHVASIFKKLNARTRIEAVILALSSGLVSLDEVKDQFDDRLEQ